MPITCPITPAELAVLPKQEENRTFRRRLVNLRAALEDAGVAFQDVQIQDLSEEGFRVSTHAPLEEGSALILKLPELEHFRALVIWSDGLEAGCAFEGAVPQSVVDHVNGKPLIGEDPKVKRRGAFGLKPARAPAGKQER